MWTSKAVRCFKPIFARDLSTKSVGIVGVPFDKGAGKRGVDLGPKALRDSGLIDDIKNVSPSIIVKDYGDIEYESSKTNARKICNLKALEHVAACNKALADKIGEIKSENDMSIMLGGDHCLAVGSISGLLRHTQAKNLRVLWVDAHIDMNTASTSPSGNMHGTPVSLLVKELRKEWPTIPELEWCRAELSLSNFCFIGLRSIDHYERVAMEKFEVNYFDMRDIEKMGIDKVVHRAFELLEVKDDTHLHVSFDIDALDPIHALSTGTPVAGGKKT